MKEQLIQFETAKLAKEKGFNLPSRWFYADWVLDKNPNESLFKCMDIEGIEYTSELDTGSWGNVLLVPTQSLLQKWLREEYNCIVEVIMHSDHESKPIDEFRSKTDFLYAVEVNYYGKNFEVHQGEHSDFFKTHFDSYEQALELGLQEALKLI